MPAPADKIKDGHKTNDKNFALNLVNVGKRILQKSQPMNKNFYASNQRFPKWGCDPTKGRATNFKDRKEYINYIQSTTSIQTVLSLPFETRLLKLM